MARSIFSRGRWSIFIALAIALPLSAVGPAAAHDGACGSVSGANSTSCVYACESGRNLRLLVDAEDDLATVGGSTSCGGFSMGASGIKNSFQLYQGTTTSHSDSGSCYGEVTDDPWLDNGLRIECESVASSLASSSMSDADCSDRACLIASLTALSAKVVAELPGEPTLVHIYMLGDSAFGFSCVDGGSACISVVPTCSSDGLVQRCQIG